MRELLIAALVPFLIAASSGSRCIRTDTSIPSNQLHLKTRPFGADSPVRDRYGFDDANTTVTCRIGKGGYLTDCRTPLADARGPWLLRQFRFWRVLDTRFAGCPVIGRQVVFRVRLRTNYKE